MFQRGAFLIYCIMIHIIIRTIYFVTSNTVHGKVDYFVHSFFDDCYCIWYNKIIVIVGQFCFVGDRIHSSSSIKLYFGLNRLHDFPIRLCWSNLWILGVNIHWVDIVVIVTFLCPKVISKSWSGSFLNNNSF